MSAPSTDSTDHPLVLFAPGAGAPSSSAWMQGWARRLRAIGEVVTFDYAYHAEGRRYPDPLPKLVATHRAAMEAACSAARAAVMRSSSARTRDSCAGVAMQ